MWGGIVSRLIIGNLTELVLRNRLGEGVLYAYNSVLIFPASVSLFMAFRNIKIKSKIVTNVAASLGAVCFGTYLVTDNPLVRNALWGKIDLLKYCETGLFGTSVALIIVIILLFLIGCLIEKTRTVIIRTVKIEKLYKQIDDSLKVMINRLNKTMFK